MDSCQHDRQFARPRERIGRRFQQQFPLHEARNDPRHPQQFPRNVQQQRLRRRDAAAVHQFESLELPLSLLPRS